MFWRRLGSSSICITAILLQLLVAVLVYTNYRWKNSKQRLQPFIATAEATVAWAQLLLLVQSELILALRNVSVTIPTAVKRGDNAMLICNYDIENDTLYTVKWYRGRREFYRYTPKENPAWKIFAQTNNGIAVETTQSNASHVFLRNVPLTISGKFACEVSADQPTFHTSIVAAEMEVVELPTQRPIITGIHSRYRLGDIINGNCSSDYSKPAANLTWWINDIQVPPNYIRTYDVQKHMEEHLESAVLEINFVVTLQHFIKGRLKLKCSARIHDIYAQESEKLLEEDRPRILASGRSPDMNLYPFDHPTDGDGFNDQNELYLTHYKDTSSAISRHHTQSNMLRILLTLALLVILQLLGTKRLRQSYTNKYLTKRTYSIDHMQPNYFQKDVCKTLSGSTEGTTENLFFIS